MRLLYHPNPTAHHARVALLLGSAWGVPVRFTADSDALRWEDSGWLDAPSSQEPSASDVPAWVYWRSFYWEAGLPRDAHNRPIGRVADRELSEPEAEIRALNWGSSLGIRISDPQRPDPVLVVDIDHLFAYRGRGLSSFWGGLLRDLVRGRWREVAWRLQGPDPFGSFAYWADLQRRMPHLSLQFFALLAAKRGPYDRGVSWQSEAVRSALRNVALRFDVASHLSYGSHDVPGGYRSELQALEHILEVPGVRQRFHFLRGAGSLEALERLAELGVAEDWSMEFADVPGFRNGWANAHEVLPGLVQVPVAAMDQNFLGLQPRQVADRLHALQSAAWKVGAPLRVGTHWRIFGPHPEVEQGAADYGAWRDGLELWLMECAKS